MVHLRSQNHNVHLEHQIIWQKWYHRHNRHQGSLEKNQSVNHHQFRSQFTDENLILKFLVNFLMPKEVVE